MYMRRQTPAADSALATGSRGHDEAWPSEGTFLDSRLRGNDRMRRCSRMLPGFGVSPKSLFYTPKSGGQGVGIGFMREVPSLDSRLRGNDSGGCRESFLPMVWLSSPSPLSSPVEGEEIGLGVQRGKAPLPRVWGCPSTPFFYSPMSGGSRGLIAFD